jgi:5'-nucleotidase (lipoprotein e(P4) family)
MNRRLFIFLTALLLSNLMACRVQKIPAENYAARSLVVQGPLWGAMWQQKAAEYKALCYQAYNLARLRLDAILQQSTTKPFAIVTDIDETILDNSPYAVHQSLQNLGYADSSWMEWTAKLACDTIPGALTFLKYASSKGVKIFYITNRLEAERGATIKNLEQWNFPDAENDHLFLKQTTSGKEDRRKLVERNHEVVLLMGDNLSDFSSVFDKQPFDKRDVAVTNNAMAFGDKYIVLPNTAYGDWEGALYNYNYKLTTAQKDSMIKVQLRGY